MEPRILSRSRAKRDWRLLAFAAALGLAALACGVPLTLDPLASSNAPYYTCNTATPIPTVTYVRNERNMTATPDAFGVYSGETITEREYGLTTPVPTETPFYQIGEFYLGEPAVIGTWEVTLHGVVADGEYTRVSMAFHNRSGNELRLASSVQIVVFDANNTLRHYDPAGQTALALPDPVLADSTAIAGGEEVERVLAFKGAPPEKVALMTNWLGDASKPIWFHATGNTRVTLGGACAHGITDWTVAAGGGYDPPPLPVGSYAEGLYKSVPLSGNAKFPVAGPFYMASPHTPPSHRGLDYTSCVRNNCSWTPFAAGESGLLRMGPSRPDWAVMAGTVTVAQCGFNSGYGCYVVIRSQIGPSDYIYTYYAHMWGGGGVSGSFRTGVADPTCDPSDCSRTTIGAMGDGPGPLVAVGQFVPCGTNLGFVGMSGRTTGPHLHFEMRRGPFLNQGYLPGIGNQVDPDVSRMYWPSTCNRCSPGDYQCEIALHGGTTP